MATAANKRVRVCLRSDPRLAVDCPVVTLDCTVITRWSEPLLAALAAGATAHAAAEAAKVPTVLWCAAVIRAL